MNVNGSYEEWLTKTESDRQINGELLSIKDNFSEIEDRFFKGIAFGTGGLRGKLGTGINRMNVYTVGCVTFGLADYILKNEKSTVSP